VVLTILKNMNVNGKDDIPYMKWKIIQTFETTNQYWFIKQQTSLPVSISRTGAKSPTDCCSEARRAAA